MSAEALHESGIQPASSGASSTGGLRAGLTRKGRLWPIVVLVVAFWAFRLISGRLDLPIYVGFLSQAGACALLALGFTSWWLVSGTGRLTNRLWTLAALVAIAVVGGILSDHSVGAIGMMLFAVPLGISAAVAWLLLVRKRSVVVGHVGMIAALAIFCAASTLVRVDGIDGDQKAAVSWRWSRTAEDLYLAGHAGAGKADASAKIAASAAPALALQPGDWAEFRGPNRRAEVRGIKIATNWKTDPPKAVWQQRIGPAWSSILIVDDRLFTQEQRGEFEAVVCLNAQTGKEIWVHQDKGRWSDGQAGAGPRATPVFAAGRIFSLGGTGILNCLDAATGRPVWSRNLVNDSGASIPMWGFSSSPLIAEKIVVVYAGGDKGKELLGYQAETGEIAWTTATGPISYSSAQLASIGGENQVLFLSDRGLIAVDPLTGKVLWKHDAPQTGVWRVALPCPIDQKTVLIGYEDLGLVRLDVAHDGKACTPTKRWESRAIRPAFNDFVTFDGCVYGFDESLFCCVDLETGKRRWKAGRYGHGQVLLLPEQRLLVVISESGEIILLAARPDQHEELARLQAISGKTWNHPVIAHGRLYIRNAEEIACLALPTVH
jgi:outer membrane protein assembly factor BamB